MLTAERIKRFAPGARADIVQALVDGEGEIRAAGINTPLRLAHFLAQISPETGGLRKLEENLRYSAPRLREVWPRRFPTPASAMPFANNPEALAEKVYAGRNGNTKPGDGWRFRGRGMMQTTGRANYRKVGRENDPDSLTVPAMALTSALKFWDDNGCNAFADADDIEGLRRRINGGTTGIDEARAALAKAKRIFMVEAAPIRLVADDHEDDPVPVPEPITDKHQVSLVQTWLRNLGYTEVGIPNGEIGTFTKGAILAYRSDKGLPPGDWIDDPLLLTLAKDKEPRPIAPERANATPAEVREKAPVVHASWCAKIWARAGTLVAGAATVGQGVSSHISAAKDYVQPVQDVLSDVPGWVWAAIACAVAAYIWHTARQSEQSGTEAYKTAALR